MHSKDKNNENLTFIIHKSKLTRDLKIISFSNDENVFPFRRSHSENKDALIISSDYKDPEVDVIPPETLADDITTEI